MARPVGDFHLQVQGDFYGQQKHTVEGARVARSGNWVRGWWENISRTPIFIEDKWHLKKVCEAESKRTGRLIIPKAFMKAKSQGKGIEWNF